jgi:5-methyltetrahydrofolate--homocysteine methyltransferase
MGADAMLGHDPSCMRWLKKYRDAAPAPAASSGNAEAEAARARRESRRRRG